MRRLAPAVALAMGACASLKGPAPVDSAGSHVAVAPAASRAVPVTEARPTSDLGRIKAALAILATPTGDEAEALALVEPVARRTDGDPETKAMAGFLQALVSERRRLKESAAGANAKLREQRQRADALQAQAVELQQKLDALADLEKSLSGKQVTKP